jgi:light-regulated signal transduction histidine kinase (bacteriophytochrome)
VLNDVRFYPDAALKMKLSLTRTEIPAVQAALGRRGVFRGIDYRGKKVVAFLTAVPDSPWCMESKMDADEVFAGTRFKLALYYVMTAVLFAAVFISTFVMRQRAMFFKRLHEKDETLRSYASRLEEANKELEAFSYSVSHDLRAPLRGMDGFSKALLDEYADKLDDVGKGYLARVRAAAKNMGTLIDDLLNLSRIGRFKLEIAKVDLSRLAERIAAELKKEAPGREAEFLIQPNLSARADARLLEIALQNMLGNAWKFTSKNPSAKIEFGSVRSEGRDAYFVRDNGVGFDQRYYDKLFNPFQRLHSEKDYPGTGIGLVTVKRIIERHGGRVRGESEASKGATFYFTLNSQNKIKETV